MHRATYDSLWTLNIIHSMPVVPLCMTLKLCFGISSIHTVQDRSYLRTYKGLWKPFILTFVGMRRPSSDVVSSSSRNHPILNLWALRDRFFKTLPATTYLALAMMEYARCPSHICDVGLISHICVLRSTQHGVRLRSQSLPLLSYPSSDIAVFHHRHPLNDEQGSS